MRYLFIPKFNLQIFADAGTAGADGAGSGEENAAVNSQVAAAKSGGKEDLSKVVYGTQADSSLASPTAVVRGANYEAPVAEERTEIDDKKDDTKPVDRKAAFEALIKGEYKDIYGAKVESAVKGRLKGAKQAEAKLGELTPLLTMLAEKYSVDPNDVKALSKAIEDDDTLYADEAMEKGVTVSELKAQKKMARENAMLRAEIEKRDARAKADEQYTLWANQAKDVKAIYEGFDIRTELQNPRFVDLLNAGIDMKTAFEVLHQDELVTGAMQAAAKAAASQAAKSAAANAARPVENGTSKRSAAHVKSDVNTLGNDDIDEVIRRVKRGEKISFSS